MGGQFSAAFDQSGRLILVDPVFVEALGFGAQDFVGQRPPYPWWPEDQHPFLLALFESVIGEGGEQNDGVEVIARLRDRAGSVKQYIVSSKRLPNGVTTIFARPFVESDALSNAIELLKKSLFGSEREDHPALPENPRFALLSPSELRVCSLLLEGNSSAQIADTLHLSIHTVRNHRKAIYRKLGVSSQVELMRTIAEASRGDSAHQ